MSQTPDEIRADIERTRGELGTDVDALADKVRPSSIAHRQGERLREGFANAKNAVMGTADNVGSSVGSTVHGVAQSTGDAVHDAGTAVQQAPQTVVNKTRGNPLAAGLIAFGAGWLVSSLVPASEKEREAAQALKEKSQPVVDELGSAAREVVEDMKEPARQAMQDVKSSASDSASVVKEEGAAAAQDVKVRAQEAQDNIKDSGTP